MKKFATLVMGLTAVFALTACGGKGKEVKAEELQKQAANIEDHQYSEATIKYSYSIDSTGMGETEKDSEKATVKYSYNSEKKEWTTDNTDAKYADMFEDLLYTNLKAMAAAGELDISGEAMAQFEQYGKAEAHYYTNPFGLEAKATFDYNEDGTVMKGSIYAYYAFDKYGYCTKIESKTDITMKMSIMGYEIDGASKVNMSATVSYK